MQNPGVFHLEAVYPQDDNQGSSHPIQCGVSKGGDVDLPLCLVLRKPFPEAPHGYPILCPGPHLGHLLPVNLTRGQGE